MMMMMVAHAAVPAPMPNATADRFGAQKVALAHDRSDFYQEARMPLPNA